MITPGRFSAFNLVVCLLAPTLPAQEVRLPSTEEIQRITAAMPAQARARPSQHRRLLVMGRNGSHDPVPYAAAAFRILGEKTGAFEAVISNDGSMFEPEKLRAFDAVLINNWHGFNPFLPMANKAFKALSETQRAALKKREAALRRSFLSFVAGGKGVIGIHAATVGLDDWPEYAAMIGGKYAALPWMQAVIRIEDASHPVCAAFHGQSFTIADEIYEMKAPYSRETLRLLLSVDTARTTEPKSSKYGRPVRTDNDYGLSWVKSYGRGRVFYCALGHFYETYWNPLIVQHFLDGIQFALGDLPADTTPTAKQKSARRPKP